MAICELMCWGILLRDLECKTDRHHDFFALQNLSVVCPLLLWQSLDPPPFSCMNKAGFLPSTGVMLSRDLKQYDEPLRLPSRSNALSFPYSRQSVVSPPS